MINTFNMPFLWSKQFLTSGRFLWCLFWINFLGTLYGYQWYYNQMFYTVKEMNPWLVVFVPDSPTASLFFTLAILYLLWDNSRIRRNEKVNHSIIRKIIEALAVITSFKYGIWAVTMIILGGFQGSSLQWQDWMLMTSHLGMAFEALLFVRFFKLSSLYIAIAAIWTVSNDIIDYHFLVYPWLPSVLEDDLAAISWFTFCLGILSIVLSYALSKYFSVKNE